jgi:hypothetical protein
VERAEAAAEGGGRADGAAEGAAGEGGAYEGREVGEAEEDLAEEILAEVCYSGGTGWRRRRLLHGRRLWRARAAAAGLGTAGAEEEEHSSDVGCATRKAGARSK